VTGSNNRDWPVIGISYLAMVEYAHWRTRNERGGWSYRLPSDLEWEKAARGADQRIYVWGDYMVWSYCTSLFGMGPWRPRVPLPVGSAPIDESVYGVRDLEGSAEELTSGRPQPDWAEPIQSIRGGSWDRPDENFFRVATRNGIHPTASSRQLGIRLVAEPRKP
jgi:serine/threonine-protein kinase